MGNVAQPDFTVQQWRGSWDSDPAIGDYKVIRFFKDYRDDDWYQASLNIKGDLGFAELSVTAIVLRP